MTPEKHICPVCGFDGLKEEAFSPSNGPSYEVCPRCGFEFGYDGGNDPAIFKEYHQRWIKNGSKWFIPQDSKS
jgi:rubredoxin